MTSKAYGKIKGSLLLTMSEKHFVHWPNEGNVLLEPGICSFTSVDEGVGLLTGCIISVCPAPLDLFVYTGHSWKNWYSKSLSMDGKLF